MSEWKTLHISDIGKIVTGKTPRTSIETNYGGSIPFLTPSDDLSGKFVPQTNKTITEQGLSEVRNCLLPPNSICVSCIGSDLGKVVKTTRPLVTNQQFNSIIPNNDEFDSDFVYYLMLTVGKRLNYIGKTSTAVPIVNKTHFSNFEVNVPSLEKQRLIANILSSLDDKIEVNRRINDNLEQQAQALYKQWFVDNCSEEWEEKSLGEIINIYDSLRRPLSGHQRDKMEKIYPYYGAASLMDYVDNYLFDGVYLLLGEDGTVVDNLGYPILQYVWGKFWVNNHAHILTGAHGYSTETLYILLKQTSVKSIVTGAVQPKISQANLKSIQIVTPPIDLLDKYNKLITPLFDNIRNNIEQNHRLTTLRDTLLPKLMSGELSVNDVLVD